MAEAEKNLKFIVSVLLISSTLFLISAISLFFMRQSEIEKRVLLEKRLEEINKEKARLTEDLNEAILVKNDLEVKLGSLQEKARLLENQLVQEKSSRETLYYQLESEKKESKKLVDEVMRLKEEKEQVALSLVNVKGECDLLKIQLYSIQQAKEILENRLKEILVKKEVELEKIVVKPEITQIAQASNVETPTSNKANETKGEILIVNKRFDFAVINLGENVGIEPGMNLGVYRDGKFLAILEIEKVHANMSAAKIPPEAKNIDIREGDEVVVVQ